MGEQQRVDTIKRAAANAGAVIGPAMVESCAEIVAVLVSKCGALGGEDLCVCIAIGAAARELQEFADG